MPRRDRDPYGAFRFALELGSIQVAGFAECTGLNVETKVYEYKEGGNNATTLKFPEHAAFGNITLKRGLSQATDLIDWQFEIVGGRFQVNPRSQKVNISIVVHDEAGNEVRRWNLVRAFPVKWVGPDLKAGGNDIAIETLELAHEGIERQA
jgi:phage tail-like protein